MYLRCRTETRYALSAIRLSVARRPALICLDRFQVEGYTLPNGLQLVLKPGTERGHVAIRLVVGVGLDDFNCADKELPHLLEHLLFSGIDATGEGGLEERMQALGVSGTLTPATPTPRSSSKHRRKTSVRPSICCWLC